MPGLMLSNVASIHCLNGLMFKDRAKVIVVCLKCLPPVASL